LPSGRVSVRQAVIFMLAQLAVGAAVLLSLNWTSILLGVAVLALIGTYPFMKRITYWPQLFLGLNFNWGALLGWAADRSDNKTLRQIARAHAVRHIELCIRRDGSVQQSARFNPNTGSLAARFTHKGYSDESTWARAQAWAMLGYTLAAKYIPHEPMFLEVSECVSDWWINHVSQNSVAYWDFSDPRIPNAPFDTSATAIALASLLKLSALTTVEHRVRYRTAAEQIAKTLVTKFLTPVSGRDNRSPGMLTEGCFNGRIGQATKHELIWGDYFLFESLLVLTGILDPAVI
jgi:unsaturated chondroitin disaccharide hydrolase